MAYRILWILTGAQSSDKELHAKATQHGPIYWTVSPRDASWANARNLNLGETTFENEETSKSQKKEVNEK